MRRIIINSLGKSFKSKMIDSDKPSEQKFIWNQNFRKIDKLKLKSEKKVFKQNAIKSKAANNQLKSWVQFRYKFEKQSQHHEHDIESKLISKRLLTIGATDDQPEKIITNDKAIQIIATFTSLREKMANDTIEAEERVTELLLKKDGLARSDEKREKVKEINLEINTLKDKFKENMKLYKDMSSQLILKISDIDDSEIESNAVNKTKIKIANRKLTEAKKNAKSKIRKELKVNSDEYAKLKKLTLFDKIIFFNRLNVYKSSKADAISGITSKNSELTYDMQLLNLNVDVNKNDVKKLGQLKLKYAQQINNLLENLNKDKEVIKTEKSAFKEEFKKMKIENKEEWSAIRTELKSGKSSKAAKKTKRREFKNITSVKKKELKIATCSSFSQKNEISKTRNEFRNKLKYEKQIIESKYKDNILNTPIEVTSTRYWTSIISGIIFPGFNSLVNKQWIKGLAQIAFTTFVIVLLAWSLGAFPSANGNGVVGLSAIGHDPSTQTITSIGMTNGEPNDGKFFLVMGALGIIFLVLALFYWIISALNNITQNNLSRAGVRYSNWKQQKEILKTAGLPYLLSIPAMLFILFIIILPLLSTILISFTNINSKVWDNTNKQYITADGVSTPIEWLGTQQYQDIFRVMGPEFKDVFIWTIIWTLGSTFTVLILGTMMALLVNQNRVMGKTFFRVIYLLPWAVPAFITIMFFSIFFQHDGIFNKVVGNKLFTPDTDWATSGNKTKVLMIMMQGWLGHSYIFLLITGMLQSIPKSLFEAARIDGASGTKQFRTITMPIILSQIAPLIIGQFTFNFNNFGLIYLFNKGGLPEPGKSAGPQDIFISWIYKLINAPSKPNPGAAAAMSLIISVFTITPAGIMFARSKSFRRADF